MIICCSWCFSPIRIEHVVAELRFTFCCDECAAAFYAAIEDEQ